MLVLGFQQQQVPSTPQHLADKRVPLRTDSAESDYVERAQDQPSYRTCNGRGHFHHYRNKHRCKNPHTHFRARRETSVHRMAQEKRTHPVALTPRVCIRLCCVASRCMAWDLDTGLLGYMERNLLHQLHQMYLNQLKELRYGWQTSYQLHRNHRYN